MAGFLVNWFSGQDVTNHWATTTMLHMTSHHSAAGFAASLRAVALLGWLGMFAVAPVTASYGQALTESSGDEATEETTSVAAEPAIQVEDVPDDQAIESRIREALGSYGGFRSLEVAVDSGVVTLDGEAETLELSQFAEQQVASRTEGVVAVKNNLEVASKIDVGGGLSIVRESLLTLWRDFLIRLPMIVAGVFVIVLTALAAKIASSVARRALNHRRFRISLKDLLLQLLTFGIWLCGITVAAVVIFPGMTPAKALAILGLGSVALGFAFKDIVENFLAGLLILWGYPFDRGDFIRCGEIIGQVEQITIRNTMIRMLDGELAVVPNAQLFKNTVEVLTDRKRHRVRLICGVAYGEDVAGSRQVIQQAVHRCDSVMQDQPVEIFAQEFAESSINFEVAWWTKPTPTEIRRSRDEVVEAIKHDLDQAGIEIPFPYRTLTFRGELPVRQSGTAEQPVE